MVKILVVPIVTPVLVTTARTLINDHDAWFRRRRKNQMHNDPLQGDGLIRLVGGMSALLANFFAIGAN